jgi:hypothetical protein
MEQSDDDEERFQLGVNEILLDRRTLTLVLEECDHLERDTLSRLERPGQDEHRLATRRTLAKIRLMLVALKGGELDLAQRLFLRRTELGFDSLHDRLEGTALFGSLCLKEGKPELAASLLESAMEGVVIVGEDNRIAMENLLADLKGTGR